MILLRLFFEFFKTGLFSVGGGLATIPFLQAMGDNTAWFTQAELANMIAVSESTPGPMGVNMAVYVGFHLSGIAGAVVAALGLVAPSIIVSITIAHFLAAFRKSKTVEGIFYGLRPASTGLIGAAGISVAVIALLDVELWQSTGAILDLFQWKAILLAVAVFIGTQHKKLKKIHPIAFIAFSAVVGIVFSF